MTNLYSHKPATLSQQVVTPPTFQASEKMQVHVQTLENAHRMACPLLTLEFARPPTVRDVLERIRQNPQGVKVLLWGEDELGLDDVLPDGADLTVTDQAAERLMQLNNGLEERSRYLTNGHKFRRSDFAFYDYGTGRLAASCEIPGRQTRN